MEKLKQKKFVALVLTICLLIASSSISWTVYAATHPSFTTIIEGGSMVETASYIIFKDGSTIFAKNGTTGAIDYSGSNTSQIIQNALNEHGVILILNALYSLTSRITIPSDTFLQAESWATILANDGTTLDYFINIDGAKNVTISGFSVDVNDNSNGGTGIYANNSHNILICQNNVYNADGHAIFIDASVGQVSSDVRVINNKVYDAAKYCVQLRRVCNGIVSNNCFNNVQTAEIGNYGGICVWTGCEQITVDSNNLQGGEYAVRTDGNFISISDNNINHSYYGVYVFGNKTQVSGNTVYNTSIGIAVNGWSESQGHYTVIDGNIVYYCDEEGIQVNGKTDWNITGIVISNNVIAYVSLSAGTDAGIETSYLFGDVIVGNYASSSDYYGVRCASGGEHIILGNNLKDCNAAYQADGSGNIVEHNLEP